MPDEVIKPPTISNNSLDPKPEYIEKDMFVKFNRSCLIKQNKFTFNKKILNIYIVYDLDSNLNNFDPILENCLFGAIKITKNSDTDKYKHSSYGLSFDSKGVFSHPTGSFGNNAVIFIVDAIQVVLFMLPIELTRFWYLEKVLHKLTIQQFMQKKCIQLILVQLKKHSL